MNAHDLPTSYQDILVTGGAGFVGSHIIENLIEQNRNVTLLDDFSASSRSWLQKAARLPGLEVIEGELSDLEKVRSALSGKDLVIHLAAKSETRDDAPDAYSTPHEVVQGTISLLQGMKEANITELLFASSGAVYGEGLSLPFKVQDGPLLPISKYAAGKLASEAYISAYCHLYDLRAWIFRLGNIVGGRMTRGIIRDLMLKIKANHQFLELQGDGSQQKTYLLVEDCIAGMWCGLRNIQPSDSSPCAVLNLANMQPVSAYEIAEDVKNAMGLPNIPIKTLGGSHGWAGDQPNLQLDVSQLTQLGWLPSLTSRDATKQAIQRMITSLDEEIAGSGH